MSEWKETDLGKIPQKWDFINANVYCSKVTDGTHDSPKEQAMGKPLITSKHIKGRIIDFAKAYLINESDFNKINERSKVDQWDVIISMIGEYCGFSFIERNSDIQYAVKNVGLFKAGNEMKATWLHYYLQSPIGKSYLEGVKSGTSQPYITLGALRSLPILIPNNELEQTAIASLLSSLDDKIELLHRQNATLEKMAETLFRQWFVEEAKEDWEIVKVGNFVTTNSSTITKNYPYKVIEYLDTSSLNNGMMGEFQTLNLSEAPSRAKRLVHHNDILISTVRPDQKHFGIVKDPQYNIVVSTGFCVISCKNISPHFIYLLLTNDEMTDFLHSIAEGSTSTYPSLKPSDIEKVEFQLPPKSKLDEFENICSSYWDKIKSNQAQIRTLIALRETLLPKLMSGEVRVNIN